MKITPLIPILALAFAPMLRAQETKTTEAKPEKKAAPTEEAAKPAAEPAAVIPVIDKALLEKVSYFYGTRMASEFVENGVNIEVDALAQGLRDTIDKKPLKYEQAALEESMKQFAQAMMAKQQKEAAEAGSKNIAEAEKFLTENAKRKEVTTTASGLQYEVLKKGEGAKPAAADTVSVHYHGTLINGKVFDSSVQRGEPATFPVGGVIPGWVEALQLMPVGAKYKLFIPSKLAYGEQGAGPDITPNSALVFEVELLSIAPKK